MKNSLKFVGYLCMEILISIGLWYVLSSEYDIFIPKKYDDLILEIIHKYTLSMDINIFNKLMFIMLYITSTVVIIIGAKKSLVISKKKKMEPIPPREAMIPLDVSSEKLEK